MKKSYSLLSLFLSIIMVNITVPVLAHRNLLQNPGFETGDFPPWSFDGQGDWGAEINGTGGHSGDYYAMIGAGIGAVWLQQEINPPRCTMYLEFWYRAISILNVTIVRIYYSDGTTQEELIDYALNEWTLAHIDLDTRRRVEAIEIYTFMGGFAVDDFDLEACQPVGGEIYPNTISTIGSWLISGISAATVTGIVYKKRKRN